VLATQTHLNIIHFLVYGRAQHSPSSPSFKIHCFCFKFDEAWKRDSFSHRSPKVTFTWPFPTAETQTKLRWKNSACPDNCWFTFACTRNWLSKTLSYPGLVNCMKKSPSSPKVWYGYFMVVHNSYGELLIVGGGHSNFDGIKCGTLTIAGSEHWGCGG